jgi:hypothetical protein
MSWVYQTEILASPPDNAVGFVYCITNLSSNKKYIGKKLFYFLKSYQKNKKIRKKLVESDWKTYFGSNQTLKTDVELLSPDMFHREILSICYSKSQCSYIELKEQLLRDVILSPEYYNDWISAKITRKHMNKFQQ